MAITTVNSDGVTDGSIKNADIKSDAAIENTKLGAIPASKVTTGTVGTARLGTGTADNTKFLRGDSTWQVIDEYDDTTVQNNIAMLGFKIATNGSLAKYSLVDQIIDDYNDNSGIDASASTNEYREGGAIWGSAGNDYPTGGTVTTHGSYRVHSFLSTGNTNFVVPSSGTVDMLVVGGGGGGGSYGGGGAGGVRSKTGHSVTAQTYVVAVGAGATGTTTSGEDNQGDNGAASSFDSFEAAGGGGGAGASYNPYYFGLDGGSGGGGGTDIASGISPNPGAGNTPSTSPVQGYAGGSGQVHGTAHPDYSGGGGGGAGGAGAAASTTGTAVGGAGGVGIQNDFRTGSNVYYGGGGGGHGFQYQATTGVGGAGGTGGGGKGNSYSNDDAVDGTANTGGGGGGGDEGGGAKTSGGSGIVVIRYATTQFPGIGDLTLVSTTTTAEANPTKGDLVTLIENTSGTATLNTDIKGYISRDGGSNWTQGTLVDEGSWGTNKKILAFHNLDISGQPAAANMRYKITTHNQSSGSKATKIHGTSLGWS